MTAIIPPQAILEPLKGRSGHVWTKAEVKHWTKLLWHTSQEQWDCLLKLNQKESAWDYQAVGDKTTQGRAYGIAQALPPSKYNVISTDWKINPMTQVVWQKKYIETRYAGRPCYALRHEKQRNWY